MAAKGAKDSESEAFTLVVSHLLGFTRGPNGSLRDNESATAKQRQSASNIENVAVRHATGVMPWESGALTDVALELGLVKNDSDEALRLKRKFIKVTTVTNSRDQSKVPSLKPRTDNLPATSATAIQEGRSGVASSFVPPIMKVPAPVKDGRGFAHNLAPQSEKIHKAENNVLGSNPFRTAYEQLKINDKEKGIQRSLPPSDSNTRCPGLRRPMKGTTSVEKDEKPKVSDNPEVEEIMSHESMKNINPKMVEAILNEVVQTTSTSWDDIAGLDGVKEIIREVIIWPMRRPDIFTGLRASPRGILFFGPPGTGKTMFGRVIANQFNSTFFNISASSLTSKWIGDGEKMVRALFAVARLKQPSVIFIDEIDSILTQRSDTEHESSRRLKTEFLIQFDGCATQNEDKILVIGVTNRPQELDEAARRRFVKRIYIPLPDVQGRKQLVRNLLKKYSTELSEDDYNEIAQMTEGYSGADMNSLCREAAYGPIREVGHLLDSIHASQVRPMQMKDFVSAQKQVKSSVASSDVTLYQEWDDKFGCHI